MFILKEIYIYYMPLSQEDDVNLRAKREALRLESSSTIAVLLYELEGL